MFGITKISFIFVPTNTETMKNLLSEIAVKLIENNISNESILICGSILKRAFIQKGFSPVVANTMAIDGMKITLKTISKIKV
jgi:hypothetical protein